MMIRPGSLWLLSGILWLALWASPAANAQSVSNPQPDFELSFNGQRVEVASALVYSEGSLLKLELWSEARSCRSIKRDSRTIVGHPRYVAFRIVERLAPDGSTAQVISRLSAASGDLDVQVVPDAYSKDFEPGAFERGERVDGTLTGRLDVALTERSTFTMDTVEIVARGAFVAHDCGAAYAEKSIPETGWTVAGVSFPLASAILELEDGAYQLRFFTAPVGCKSAHSSDVVLSFRVDPKTHRINRYELSGSRFRSNALQGVNAGEQHTLDIVGDPMQDDEVFLKLDFSEVVAHYEVTLTGTVPVKVCVY